MAKTARAVQVPGEPTQELPATEPTQELQAAAEGDEARPVLDAEAVSDEVAALRAQLEAERIARIEAEQRAAIAVEQAASAAPVVTSPAPAISSQQSAKLTGNGWVVPPAYGSPVKA